MVKTYLKVLFRRLRSFLLSPLLSGEALTRSDAASQLHLKLHYRELLRTGGPLPSLDSTGFKVHSQTDEDGILLYLFAVLGETNRKCVELCAGDGVECNTANLIINHGWTGLLIDGDEELVERGVKFYRGHPNTYVYPPKFLRAWITKGNVNELLKNAGFEGEVDLLSLDLDGMDYWIWESIEVIQPRIVVLEYNDILGPERAFTVPYSDSFSAYDYPTSDGLPNYCSASLAAFVQLGDRKGYRFVGCNRYGFNAFFVLKTLAESRIPEWPIARCFEHPKVREGMARRFPTVSDLPWVDVGRGGAAKAAE